jgi:hypothetical protein
MQLPLLEQPVEGNAEVLCETRTVRADRIVVVAQVKAEVQGVVRRSAHPALPRGERMPKAVPTEKG